MTRAIKRQSQQAKISWDDSAYARRLVPDEDGGYSASIQEFPGCFAEGDTAEEALENLIKAASSWVAAQHGVGQAIPPPYSANNPSGRIALRVPRSLHKQAAELASQEGMSLNQVLIQAITAYVSQKSLANKLKCELESMANSLRQIGGMHPIYLQTKSMHFGEHAAVLSYGGDQELVTVPVPSQLILEKARA